MVKFILPGLFYVRLDYEHRKVAGHRSEHSALWALPVEQKLTFLRQALKIKDLLHWRYAAM